MTARRLVRFALVGALNTGVYFGCYLTLRLLLPYLVAHLAATAIAMTCSYFLNCYVTFGVAPHWRTAVLFPLSNAVNVVLTTAGLKVSVDWLGVDQRLAPLPVAALAVPVTYVATHYLMLGRWRDAYLDEVATEQAGA